MHKTLLDVGYSSFLAKGLSHKQFMITVLVIIYIPLTNLSKGQG